MPCFRWLNRAVLNAPFCAVVVTLLAAMANVAIFSRRPVCVCVFCMSVMRHSSLVSRSENPASTSPQTVSVTECAPSVLHPTVHAPFQFAFVLLQSRCFMRLPSTVVWAWSPICSNWAQTRTSRMKAKHPFRLRYEFCHNSSAFV